MLIKNRQIAESLSLAQSKLIDVVEVFKCVWVKHSYIESCVHDWGFEYSAMIIWHEKYRQDWLIVNRLSDGGLRNHIHVNRYLCVVCKGSACANNQGRVAGELNGRIIKDRRATLNVEGLKISEAYFVIGTPYCVFESNFCIVLIMNVRFFVQITQMSIGLQLNSLLQELIHKMVVDRINKRFLYSLSGALNLVKIFLLNKAVVCEIIGAN